MDVKKMSVSERIEKSVREIKAQLPEIGIFENEPMKKHCSFKAGGPARAFVIPEGEQSAKAVCGILKANALAPFILGNGTNVVFPDEGTPDLIVVSTEKLSGISLLEDGCIYAEAGVSLSRLAGFALENGLEGLEFASGIPGTVGGGCIMNAGAYGGELKDSIEAVNCFFFPDQEIMELTNEMCSFGYRRSVFQDVPDCLILSAVFRLRRGNREEISSKMKRLNEQRREKQPLDMPSAGSTFRRPEGSFAAALIDEAGLKGFSIGGAQVSEKHAGFIVNTGGATAGDLKRLMEHVRDVVREKSGKELEPEVILLSPEYTLEDI